MTSSLRVEKLDRSNYASWSYKMHQYLLGHGYWSYVEGVKDSPPETPHNDFPVWEHAASRVMYCFASSVGDQLLSHIRDAKTLKDAWGNLTKVFPPSTTARKLQLKQELSNVRQKNMSVTDYTTRIEGICDSLASINVTVEEDEMVEVCLGGLASKFGAFRIAVCTREKTPSFFDLQSMLLVEENHAGASTSASPNSRMLFTVTD